MTNVDKFRIWASENKEELINKIKFDWINAIAKTFWISNMVVISFLNDNWITERKLLWINRLIEEKWIDIVREKYESMRWEDFIEWSDGKTSTRLVTKKALYWDKEVMKKRILDKREYKKPVEPVKEVVDFSWREKYERPEMDFSDMKPAFPDIFWKILT